MSKDYLPVTEAAAVENKIAQSVKISKQLMRSELERKIKEAEVALNELSSAHAAAADLFNTAVRKLFEEATEQYVQKDSDITRFRNLYNKFSSYGEEEDTRGEIRLFKTNKDMINAVMLDTARAILSADPDNGIPNHIREEDWNNYINHNTVPVVVELRVNDYDHEQYGSDYIGFTVDLDTPKGLPELAANFRSSLAIYRSKASEVNNLRSKLLDIDQVAEQMEAQLLVQELSKTEEGRLALQTAGDLVGGMLGETPQLLTIQNTD